MEFFPRAELSKLAMASKLVAMASEAVCQLTLASKMVAMASCTVQQLKFCHFRFLGSIQTIPN
jgi:hypothetical protein